jgi:Subtilisin inhibitor-like
VRDQQHSPGKVARWLQPLRFVRRLAVLAVPVMLLTVGCANQIAGPSGPTPGTTMPVTPSEQATPAPTAETDLTIVLNTGSGSTRTWRLTCKPPGGTHPDPKAACRALESNGAVALPPVPKDKACTQIYGGPETASITGTWQGQRVMSTFARNDGCQISRWKLMEGVLPPGGS